MIQKLSISSEYHVIAYDAAALNSMPLPMRMRGSVRGMRRPTMIMLTAVARPRGAMTSPAVRIG